MDVTIEEDGACRKTLKVAVAADKVQTAFDKVATDFIQHADLPGYRKGRAPASLVKNKYRKQILEQVRDQLVPESYREAIEEKSLEIASVIGATDPVLKLGEPMTFEVTLDTVPEFDLPTYKGLTVTRELKEVSDDDVNDVIGRILAQQADYFDRKEGGAVETDDLVQIDYSGTLDGAPMADLELQRAMYADSTDFWTQANDQAIFPELGSAIVGLASGGETAVEVTFPDAFAEEALRGKTASYAVTVKAVRGRNVPELTDEIATGMGAESADDLRQKVRDNLEGEVKEAADRKLRNDLIGQVVEPVTISVPDSVVESETRNEIYNMVGHYSRQGLGDDAITEHKSEIFETANKNAQQRVKVRYILKRIAKEEEIKVEQEEFDAEVHQMAVQAKVTPDEMRNTLRERDGVDDVHDQILIRKTIDFLLEQADVQG